MANSYKYDPYGAIVTQSETTAHPNPFRFAGGLYSSSVGLHKFGARWYDQTIGHWSQQDPIDQTGDLQQGNRYLYVGDNPVNRTDPNGASSVSVGCSAARGLGGAAGYTADSSGGHRSNGGLAIGIGGGCNAMLYSGGSAHGQSQNVTGCFFVCVGAGTSGFGVGLGLDVGITETITHGSFFEDLFN